MGFLESLDKGVIVLEDVLIGAALVGLIAGAGFLIYKAGNFHPIDDITSSVSKKLSDAADTVKRFFFGGPDIIYDLRPWSREVVPFIPGVHRDTPGIHNEYSNIIINGKRITVPTKSDIYRRWLKDRYNGIEWDLTKV